jgi:hypothetical protein
MIDGQPSPPLGAFRSLLVLGLGKEDSATAIATPGPTGLGRDGGSIGAGGAPKLRCGSRRGIPEIGPPTGLRERRRVRWLASGGCGVAS